MIGSTSMESNTTAFVVGLFANIIHVSNKIVYV
jgi:hypothetical protein